MEEDIEYLNKMIKELRTFGDLDNLEFENREKICISIENLISRNKELEEENIELKKLEDITYEVLKDTNLVHKYYVPKSKIKEKIEEIKNTGIDVAWEQINYSIKEQDRAKIQVLQQLLEE